MNKRPKTYHEYSDTYGVCYYAVVYLPSGHDYYSGPFHCRSTAYRHAIKEQSKHDHATRNHMVYNVRLGG